MRRITIDQINALPPGTRDCQDNYWPTIRKTEGDEKEDGRYRIDDDTGQASPEYAANAAEAVEIAIEWARACHVVERAELERIYREGDRQAAWDLDVQ